MTLTSLCWALSSSKAQEKKKKERGFCAQRKPENETENETRPGNDGKLEELKGEQLHDPSLPLPRVLAGESHMLLPREGVKCLHSKISVPPQMPNLDQYLNRYRYLLSFTFGCFFLVGSVDNQKPH